MDTDEMRRKFQEVVAKTPDYSTIGFAVNIRKFPTNPFDADTPFGKPETVAVGNVFIELDELRDKIDGLQSDLDSAVAVMRRRVSGAADIASMGEWLDLNYPVRTETAQKQLNAADSNVNETATDVG